MKRVTNKDELRDLGLKVLKVPAYKVDSALYNENEIQNAAYELLQIWYSDQRNEGEAYRNLYNQLVKNGRELLAGELKQWVQGTTKP